MFLNIAVLAGACHRRDLAFELGSFSPRPSFALPPLPSLPRLPPSLETEWHECIRLALHKYTCFFAFAYLYFRVLSEESVSRPRPQAYYY